MPKSSKERNDLLKIEATELQDQFTSDFLEPIRCAENLEPLERVIETSLFMVDEAVIDQEYLQSVQVLYEMYKQMRLLAELYVE